MAPVWEPLKWSFRGIIHWFFMYWLLERHKSLSDPKPCSSRVDYSLADTISSVRANRMGWSFSNETPQRTSVFRRRPGDNPAINKWIRFLEKRGLNKWISSGANRNKKWLLLSANKLLMKIRDTDSIDLTLLFSVRLALRPYSFSALARVQQ